MRSKVLVVEDDKRLAASVRRCLAYDGHDVEIVHDGGEALRVIRDRRPDVMVLDLMLPGLDGFEICRRVRAASDQLSILMLTARDEVVDRVSGLDAGADDYLVKPFAPEELQARVRALIRRAPTSPRDTLSAGGVRMDVEAMEAEYEGSRLDLTALEFRLLEYFLRNPRRVLTRSRILAEVWGLDADTTSNVVDVYVRYLRLKLGPGGRLIQTVRGVGYVLKEPV
jgi:two-component system response regulator MprA